LAGCRGVGEPRAPFRTINHELHGAIPLPASAENLQENFSPRLNNDPSTNVPPAAVERDRLRVEIVDRVGIVDIVAGRQDLPQIAAGDLHPGNAGRSHESLPRASPCFASPAAGPRDCPTTPVGTAACTRTPATPARSRRSSHCLRVVAYLVLIYLICNIASIAISRRFEPLPQRSIIKV
jgi:hypothetical protein